MEKVEGSEENRMDAMLLLQASLLQKPLAQRQMTPCHTVWAWASQMWALAILAPRALTFPPKYFFDGERTSMSVCEPTCVLPQKA